MKLEKYHFCTNLKVMANKKKQDTTNHGEYWIWPVCNNIHHFINK